MPQRVSGCDRDLLGSWSRGQLALLFVPMYMVLNKEVSLVVVSNERAREVDGTLVPWSALCWRVW